MKAKKETLKENVLTDIDELMDSLFGKPGTPERERFREEASIYVNGHAKTEELPKETGITGFSRPFRRAREHYLRNVKFFMQIERGGYSKALQPTA